MAEHLAETVNESTLAVISYLPTLEFSLCRGLVLKRKLPKHMKVKNSTLAVTSHLPWNFLCVYVEVGGGVVPKRKLSKHMKIRTADLLKSSLISWCSSGQGKFYI